jgi:hypothetical protein
MVLGDDQRPRPCYVNLDPKAKAGWVEWFDSLADELEEAGSSTVSAGALSKMRAHAARFILILMRLRIACAALGSSAPHTSEMATAADVRGGIALATYFLSHLERVHHWLSRGYLSPDAQKILAWIRRARQRQFRSADVSSNLRLFRRDPKRLESALTNLESASLIRQIEVAPKGTKIGTQTYETHPELFEAAPGSTVSTDSTSPDPGTEAGKGRIGRNGRDQTTEEEDDYALAEREAIQAEGG